MKMLNVDIEPFVEFLLSLELSGKQSRMRTRFIKLIGETLKVIQEERQRILDRYIKKNEDGSPVTLVLEGLERYELEDPESYNAEYTELMLEEYLIDETPERKDILIAVQHAVLNTELKFSGESAIQYDRFCEIVEAINYE